MRVCLGQVGQFGLIVDVRFRQSKAAYTIARIRFNIGDTIDLLQGASDRGGTTSSGHVGDFERHQRRGPQYTIPWVVTEPHFRAAPISVR
jgi:hypothetical protein